MIVSFSIRINCNICDAISVMTIADSVRTNLYTLSKTKTFRYTLIIWQFFRHDDGFILLQKISVLSLSNSCTYLRGVDVYYLNTNANLSMYSLFKYLSPPNGRRNKKSKCKYRYLNQGQTMI